MRVVQRDGWWTTPRVARHMMAVTAQAMITLCPVLSSESELWLLTAVEYISGEPAPGAPGPLFGALPRSVYGNGSTVIS